MQEGINNQYKLFSKLFNRELTDDEKQMISNAFLNGVEQGKKIMYHKAIDKLKEISK